MAFSIAAEAKRTLEECGYTFCKRAEDGWWELRQQLSENCSIVIAANPSQGDLIREQANKEGAW